MHRRIDAVVFDLDNTLVDSKVDFVRMLNRVQEYIRSTHPGIDIDNASTTMELVRRLENHLDSEVLAKDMRKIHKIMDRTELEAVPGARLLDDVPGVLIELKTMGLVLGLLTRSCGKYARAVLSSQGTIDLFNAVLCRDHSGPSKPDPLSLIRLAKVMGVEVARTLLVGDHLIDGQCARSAGAMFLAVTTGSSTTSELESMLPVAILDGLASLPDVVRNINGDL